VSGSDGRPAGDQAGEYGEQASPGGIPPSFGASSSSPPRPSLAPVPPAAVPPAPVPAPADAAPAAPAGPGPAPASWPAPSQPGSDDAGTVGWYPTGPPAAGPFANPSYPSRRAVPGLSRLAQPAGAAGWTRAWGGGRSALTNVLLFGVAPLALAGIIVAAFVFVAPGKSAASNAGFQAGAAPSPQHAWQCWRINRDLGVLNVTEYCAAAGHGTSKLVASNAYGWYCTSPSAPVDTTAACDTLYHVSDAVSRFAVFASPYSWQCWD
jgi:hypothetical protein